MQQLFKLNEQMFSQMLLAPSIVAAFLFNVFREEIDDRRIIFKTNKGEYIDFLEPIYCSAQEFFIALIMSFFLNIVPCTPNSSVSILGPFPSVNCTSLPYVWCMRYLGIWNAAGFFCTSFIQFLVVQLLQCWWHKTSPLFCLEIAISFGSLFIPVDRDQIVIKYSI